MQRYAYCVISERSNRQRTLTQTAQLDVRERERERDHQKQQHTAADIGGMAVDASLSRRARAATVAGLRYVGRSLGCVCA
jgi:hypothetical protein